MLLRTQLVGMIPYHCFGLARCNSLQTYQPAGAGFHVLIQEQLYCSFHQAISTIDPHASDDVAVFLVYCGRYAMTFSHTRRKSALALFAGPSLDLSGFCHSP